MNVTLITMLQSKIYEGDVPISIYSTWKYSIIAALITFVIIFLSTYLGKQFIKASTLLEQSFSSLPKSLCPEINKKSIISSYFVSSVQNSRPYQEDRYCTVGSFNGDEDTSFYALFDGHGGSRCSQFCANNLPSSIATSINSSPYSDATRRSNSGSIRKGDKKGASGFLREMDIVNGFQLCDARYQGTFSKDDGTTVVSIFLNMKLGQVITAHVGDSRAVMITTTKSFDLTIDHKPSNPSERERVELHGGRIIQYGVLRVQGILAVTRALGDFSLRPYVSNVPAVNYYELTGQECFLVLATDGLWDVMDHADVAMLLQTYVHQQKSMSECARMLAELAVQRQSLDNITVMVIDLRGPQCSFGINEQPVTYQSSEQIEDKLSDIGDEDDMIETDSSDSRLHEFEVTLKQSIEAIEQSIGEFEQ